MTYEQAKNLVAIALANFPSQQERNMQPTAKLWHLMFAELNYEIVERALARVLLTAKYFPTVSEIYEAIQQLDKPANAPSTDEAWIEVIKKLDPYRTPVWSHANIEKAVKIIGYRNMIESDNIAVQRAQFFKIYSSYLEREDNDRINNDVLKLVGGLKLLRN